MSDATPPPPTSFVDREVSALLVGEEGSAVVQRAREHATTYQAFVKSVSRIRRTYLRRAHRAAGYDEDMVIARRLVRSAEETAMLDRFCELAVEEQYDALRRMGPLLAQNEALCRHMSDAFRLLPPNLDSLCLSREDQARGRAADVSTLLHRNRQVVVVPSPGTLLARQRRTLDGDPGVARPVELILALLLVSGRRETELLSPRSTFQAVPDMPYHARFSGVLKKRSAAHVLIAVTHEVCITIPLLCEYALFDKGLTRMRMGQRGDIGTLTNDEISRRYCGQLLRARKAVFPSVSKTHDLRALYCQFVNVLFEHTLPFPMLCMQCLGHDVLQDSLHYMCLRLGGDDATGDGTFARGINGPLHHDRFEQFLRLNLRDADLPPASRVRVAS